MCSPAVGPRSSWCLWMWWLNPDDSESRGKTLPEWPFMCYYKTSLCALLPGSLTASWVTQILCLKPIAHNVSWKVPIFLSNSPPCRRAQGRKWARLPLKTDPKGAKLGTLYRDDPFPSLVTLIMKFKGNFFGIIFIFTTGHFQIQWIQRHDKDNLSGDIMIP